MKGDADLANYQITSAWLDGETIRYRLNNNSVRPAYTGRNIENVSNTASTINFAQGEFIKVMNLNVTSGGVSSAITVGQRKVQRQQPETSSFQQQYDKRGSRNNSNDREINDRYGDDSEDNGTSGSIASWLARRWWIAVKKWLKYGWNGTDFPDLFFFLLPFIPFIILYYLISGIYGTAVNAVDSAADKFSSENDKPVQTSVVTESSGNPAGELPWRLPQTSETTESSGNGSDAQSSAVAESAVKNNNFSRTKYSDQGQIKGTNVNMREYPNLNGRVIFRFPGGEYVTIHEVIKPEQGKHPWLKVSYKNMTGWVYGQFLIERVGAKEVPSKAVVLDKQQEPVPNPSESVPQKAENKIQLTGERIMFPFDRSKNWDDLEVYFYGNDRPKDKRYGSYAVMYPGEHVYMTNSEPLVRGGYQTRYLVKHETLGFVWIEEDPREWRYDTHETYRVLSEHPDVEVYQTKKWLKDKLGCSRVLWDQDRRKLRRVLRSTSIVAGDYVFLTSKRNVVWHDRLGLVEIGSYPWQELAGEISGNLLDTK